MPTGQQSVTDYTALAASLKTVFSHWVVDTIQQACRKVGRPAQHIAHGALQPHRPYGPLGDLYGGLGQLRPHQHKHPIH